VLLAAPLPTIQSLKKDESVGSMPLLPYSSMAANCALWFSYGFLKKEMAIMGPNAFGLVLALYYMKSFVKFSPPQAPTLPGSVRQHKVCVAAILASALWAAWAKVRPDMVGYAAVGFCIAMFGSPLASLKTVIKTKSAKSIPLPFTVASVANCFLWSVAGSFKLKDPNIIFPNSLGLMFGIVQVVLKLVYSDRRSRSMQLATP
jgi:solute carrier family 50 (sugar transporter)